MLYEAKMKPRTLFVCGGDSEPAFVFVCLFVSLLTMVSVCLIKLQMIE